MPHISEAFGHWKSTGQGVKFGDRVKGAKTPDEFIDGLQCKNNSCAKYNTANPNYRSDYLSVYKSVLKYMSKCKDVIEKECKYE